MHRVEKRLTGVALGLTSLLLCAGCAGGSIPAVPAAPAARPSAPPSPAKAARPLDPRAPATYRPVRRDGQSAKPTLRAGNAGFTKSAAAKYRDGVWVRVDQVRQGAEQGAGPGAFPRRPFTALSLSLHNGSAKTLDLTSVVVTTTYGAPARLAPAVYDDAAARDFAAMLRPGRTATATYVFAIPADQRGRVSVTVDFDDVHVAARMSGAVR